MIFQLTLLCLSCGKSNENLAEIISNAPPSTPTLVYPTNNLHCLESTLLFDWDTSIDDGQGSLSYEIQVSKDKSFTNPVHSSMNSSTEKEIVLEKGETYYWKVKALDGDNKASDYSAVFRFSIEATGASNYLPFAPTLIRPILGSTVTRSTVTLKWIASDVDGDSLTYDVYFGTSPNPVLVSGKQSETSFSPNGLETGTVYYWKVVVQDGSDSKTVGQIWNFQTEN